MKSSLIFCSLLIIQFYSFAQKYEDYKLGGLMEKPIGNIKSLVEQQFTFVNDSITNPQFLNSTNLVLRRMKGHELDKEKRTVLNSHYNVKDTTKFYSKGVFRFDSLENLTYLNLGITGSNVFIYRKLKYDSYGHVIESKSYKTNEIYKDSLVGLETRKYDVNGNLIEDERYGDTKKWGLEIRHTYTYDKNGNMLTRTTFVDPESEEYRRVEPCEIGSQKYATTDKGYIHKDVMAYQNNRLVETFSVNKSGCIKNRVKKEYDNDGNKIKEIEYELNGNIRSQWAGQYIDRRLVLEITKHGNGEYAYSDSCRWNYDPSGDLLEKIKYSPRGIPFRIIRYTYDNFHNWVTRLEIENNKGKEFIRRRINYY